MSKSMENVDPNKINEFDFGKTLCNSEEYLCDSEEYLGNSEKEKYFEKINKFLEIMDPNKNVSAKELDEKIAFCLSILSKHNLEGKDEVYIKASNKKFKLACKFLSYYYGFKMRQVPRRDVCKFVCCQYKANNYKLSGVSQRERPKYCSCGKLTEPTDKKVSKLCSNSKFNYYSFNTDSIFFYFQI